MRCTICNVEFPKSELEAHLQTDFHLVNHKNNLIGKPPLTYVEYYDLICDETTAPERPKAVTQHRQVNRN